MWRAASIRSRDIETVETELMLADLDSLERRVDAAREESQGRRQGSQAQRSTLINRALAFCCARASRRGYVEVKPEEEKAFRGLGLLTAKPVLYVCNVEEASAATGNDFSRRVEARAKAEGAGAVVISAQIEAEIAVLPPAERAEYLDAIGLEEPGLDRLIRAGYDLLAPRDLLHRGPEGGARLDHHAQHAGAAGGGRHPYRFRARLHPRRDHRL